MGKFSRINWVLFCVIVFIVSRLIMLYQYNIANLLLEHYHSDFFKVMCKWDCKWYLTIINDGYDLVPRTTPKIWKGLANWAFFPLYPIVVKLLSAITHIKPVILGVVLNQVFIFLSLLVFYRYLKLVVNEINSRFGVIILAFSPFSIYFASVYTEALFLLLSLLSFYFMRTGRLYLSAIFGGLLSATRPIGMMFSAVLFFFNLKSLDLSKKNIIRACVLSVIAVFGLVIYMVYLQIHAGDFLAFKHIQTGWGRHGFKAGSFGQQLMNMVKDSYNFAMFMISCGLSIFLFVKKYREEAIFNLLCIMPGALTGTMMSEGRFCGTLFTFYFGLVIFANRSNTLKLSLAVASLVLYISYFMYWMAHSTFLI